MKDQFTRNREGKIIGRHDGNWLRDRTGKLVARYDEWDGRTRDSFGKIIGNGDQRLLQLGKGLDAEKNRSHRSLNSEQNR